MSDPNVTCALTTMHLAIVEAKSSTLDMVGSVEATVVSAAMLLASLCVALCGSRIIRPALAIAALLCGGAAASYVAHTYANIQTKTHCDVALAVVCGCALLCALISLAVLPLVICILGAAAGATVVAVTFDACGTTCLAPTWATSSTLLERPLVPFWAGTLVGACIGACGARRQRDRILIVVTALVGAWGVKWSIAGLLALSGSSLPQWAELAVFACTFSLGATVQRYLKRRSRTRDRKASGSSRIVSR